MVQVMHNELQLRFIQFIEGNRIGDCVNWLQNWPPTDFGLFDTDKARLAEKKRLEDFVKDTVDHLHRSPYGIQYRISMMYWESTNNPSKPLEERLVVCLIPGAIDRDPGPGSNMNPQDPGKP